MSNELVKLQEDLLTQVFKSFNSKIKQYGWASWPRIVLAYVLKGIVLAGGFFIANEILEDHHQIIGWTISGAILLDGYLSNQRKMIRYRKAFINMRAFRKENMDKYNREYVAMRREGKTNPDDMDDNYIALMALYEEKFSKYQKQIVDAVDANNLSDLDSLALK